MRGASGGGVIVYPIGASGQVLVLEAVAVEHLLAHRQFHWWQKEAGGQLFARFSGGRILVERATGPRPSDRRTRTSYQPDAVAEQREIDEMHTVGLHYVGDWHTHPQAVPTPSPPDLQSLSECVRKSKHGLNGFVLIVVGRSAAPDGLHVSVHDGAVGYPLSPIEPAATPRSPEGDLRKPRIRMI